MKKIIGCTGLLLLGGGLFSPHAHAEGNCEGRWNTNGDYIEFSQIGGVAGLCAWEVGIEMFPSSQTVKINRDQTELFTVVSRRAARGYADTYTFPAKTGSTFSPRAMSGHMRVDMKLEPITGMMYNGKQVFRVGPSSSNAYLYLGVVFEAQLATDNGQTTASWQPITGVSNNIQGFFWQNRTPYEGYRLNMRATYILLDQYRSVALGRTFNVPVVSPTFDAYLVSDSVGVTTSTNSSKYSHLKINAFTLTIQRQTRTCQLTDISQRSKFVNLPQVTKSELDSIGQNSAKTGSFSLDVRCDLAGNQGSYPKVFVTFSDMTRNPASKATNDGTSDLLNTQSGDGYAQGVSVRFVNRKTQQAVRFGPESNKAGNPGQFALPQDASGNSTGNVFDVYYVNNGKGPNGKVSSGRIASNASYTFSYQ